MKNVLLFGALFIASHLSAQNTQPYIEVAVEESIDLKMKSVDINIFVRSNYTQMEDAKERMYYDDYYYYEEDYYYEYLLEESPKEITKEMKKEYQERQEQREQQALEMESFEANFTPYSVKDLMTDLDDRNIPYTVVLDFDEENDDEYYDYEYYYDDYRTDSVIVVGLKNHDEYEKLKSFTEDNQATIERTGKYEMESIEGKYEELLPLLAKKARKQGSLIANALDQELGGLLSCSNIHPMMDYTNIDSAMEMMEYEMEYYYEDPFDGGPEFTVSLVFRFEVK